MQRFVDAVRKGHTDNWKLNRNGRAQEAIDYVNHDLAVQSASAERRRQEARRELQAGVQTHRCAPAGTRPLPRIIRWPVRATRNATDGRLRSRRAELDRPYKYQPAALPTDAPAPIVSRIRDTVPLQCLQHPLARHRGTRECILCIAIRFPATPRAP